VKPISCQVNEELNGEHERGKQDILKVKAIHQLMNYNSPHAAHDPCRHNVQFWIVCLLCHSRISTGNHSQHYQHRFHHVAALRESEWRPWYSGALLVKTNIWWRSFCMLFLVLRNNVVLAACWLGLWRLNLCKAGRIPTTNIQQMWLYIIRTTIMDSNMHFP
jgi:hypothetical protein